MSIINSFPDELVSNEKKKSFEFAKDFASAIWGDWEQKYLTRNKKFQNLKDYALGNQNIDDCKSKIKRKFIKEEFLHIDWDDKIKILPQMLRNYRNSVDMSEFSPVVRAIDYSAMEIKSKRKSEKMKLFNAKDFLTQAAQMNGGQSPIPLDQIPQSKEQINLEEDAAKPLRIERGEEKALQFVLLDNYFKEKQTQVKDDATVYNLFGGRLYTDPVEGIKIQRINPLNIIHGEKNDIFFSDSKYFGEVKEISVGMLKNIIKESNATISNAGDRINLTDEEIKKMSNDFSNLPANNKSKIKVLFYTFETYFQEVFKKKLNPETGKISLIDRTKDIGTDKEYNPKSDSYKSEKLVDNYTVWFEGVMVLDSKNTIIRHRLVNNIPEFRGNILQPYVICSPREVPLVEEMIPAIKSIQQLRYRILHHRNILKGTITDIDPDSIADITLGKEPLTPEEVLSFYFSLQLSFTKRTDSEGDPIQGVRPINEIPATIPYALQALTTQYVQELQAFYSSWGAYQYDQQKPDPKTQDINEPFRNSDNVQFRDITDSLFTWNTKVMQNVSSRINDAFEFPAVKQKFIDNIGFDDQKALEQWKKDRAKHSFHIYTDYVMTKKDRTELSAAIDASIARGELEVSDKLELMNIINLKEAAAKLTLKVTAFRQKNQDYELNKIKENQNQNILAAQTAGDQNRQTLQLEYQLKTLLEKVKFDQDAFLLQKNGEIKLNEATVQGQAKVSAAQFAQKFTSDLAITKKQIDRETMLEKMDKSKESQAELIKLRQGKIEDVNQPNPAPEVDLATI